MYRTAFKLEICIGVIYSAYHEGHPVISEVYYVAIMQPAAEFVR